MNEIEDKGYIAFDCNIKCPVSYCPYFNQNTIVTLSFGLGTGNKSRISKITHPGSQLEHIIDHWYCGVIKNSKWMHLSFLNNSLERVFSAMRKSHHIWVGFLVKNKHFIDLSQYWKLYDIEQVLTIKKRAEMPSQIWIDVIITWLQCHKPEKKTVEMMWGLIKRAEDNVAYLKIIKGCLEDSGHRLCDKITGKSKENKENVTWMKISRAKQKMLLDNGKMKLECTIQYVNDQSKSVSRSKCNITVNATNSVPALTNNGYLKIEDCKEQFEVRHWFGLTYSTWRRRRQYLSLYMNSTMQLKKLWNDGQESWIGIIF